MKKLVALLAIFSMATVASASYTLTQTNMGDVTYGGVTFTKVALGFSAAGETTLPRAFELKLTSDADNISVYTAALNLPYFDQAFSRGAYSEKVGRTGVVVDSANANILYGTKQFASMAGQTISDSQIGTGENDYQGYVKMFDVAFANNLAGAAGTYSSFDPIAYVYLKPGTTAVADFGVGFSSVSDPKTFIPSMTIPVPEPMTISMLVIGGLALLRRKS